MHIARLVAVRHAPRGVRAGGWDAGEYPGGNSQLRMGFVGHGSGGLLTRAARCGSVAAGKGNKRMAGKYEIFADEAGGYRFRLKASNGDIAVNSETYKTRTSLDQGLERFRKNAATDKVKDLTQGP